LDEKSQVMQNRLYPEETWGIRSHERDSRTAEKHGEIEATQKSRKKFQTLSLTPREGEEKLKTQSQGKPDGPGDRLTILVAG
jgi:hypothetical protein